MSVCQYKLDAKRLAEIYREQGVEAATAEFRKIINQPGYPYWGALALKDEVRKEIGA